MGFRHTNQTDAHTGIGGNGSSNVPAHYSLHSCTNYAMLIGTAHRMNVIAVK